jgi:hypothetical protein
MADDCVDTHTQETGILPRRARGASAIQRPPPQVRRAVLPAGLGGLVPSVDHLGDAGPSREPAPRRATPPLSAATFPPAAATFPPAAAAFAMAAAQARDAADARSGSQDIAAAVLASARARAAALARATNAASGRAWSHRRGSEAVTAPGLRLAGMVTALAIVVAAAVALILTHSGW